MRLYDGRATRNSAGGFCLPGAAANLILQFYDMMTFLLQLGARPPYLSLDWEKEGEIGWPQRW